MRSDEQVRIGKQQADTAEPVHGGGRPVKQSDRLRVEVEPARQRLGMKRPVSLQGSEDSASVFGLERLGPQAHLSWS